MDDVDREFNRIANAEEDREGYSRWIDQAASASAHSAFTAAQVRRLNPFARLLLSELPRTWLEDETNGR